MKMEVINELRFRLAARQQRKKGFAAADHRRGYDDDDALLLATGRRPPLLLLPRIHYTNTRYSSSAPYSARVYLE